MDQREILKDFIQNELITDGSQIDYSDDLLLSGLVNSMGVMRLAGFIHEQLGIRIPPEDVVIEHFITIDALAKYLKNHSIER